MREIVLDTETTGFKPEDGHRVIEIGCVELVNHLPSGLTRQWYINPEREVPEDAVRVHGITTEFLTDKPLFRDIVVEFLDFIGDSPLVAHNAAFDVTFLNAELKRLALPGVTPGREVIDTVQLARRKFPGSPASLDALCKRFAIDLTARTKHGALLDCQLTAQVYLELIGGRQRGLMLAPVEIAAQQAAESGTRAARQRPEKLASLITEAELAAHAAFVAKELGDKSLWKA